MKKIINFLFFLIILFSINVSADNLDGYYIYSETCVDCKSIEEDINEFIEDKNIEKIILNNETVDSIKELANEYGIQPKVPILIYKDKGYVGVTEIRGVINEDISWSIYFLGFLDGLNPCAISILMIFSSFLITLEKKKQLVFIGLSFILGESICNFLMGLGLLNLSLFANKFDLFFNIISVFTLMICIYVFLINIIDIVNFFKGKEDKVNILSLKIRYKINDIITRKITSRFIVLNAFIMGFVIAILEFGCTGQVYLPTIMYLNQINVNFILSLIVYNLMFALPLIMVLLLALFINPSNIQKNIMKYSFIIKIVVNIVLIFLFIQILNKLI